MAGRWTRTWRGRSEERAAEATEIKKYSFNAMSQLHKVNTNGVWKKKKGPRRNC